ncbi:glutamate receptor-like [Macrobrachium nipponense]|uniref:glutamate receptor-like n=1 Tax=Macrobrachium nipponense TaxID=159736 RepID=UPI0030C8227D
MKAHCCKSSRLNFHKRLITTWGAAPHPPNCSSNENWSSPQRLVKSGVIQLGGSSTVIYAEDVKTASSPSPLEFWKGLGKSAASVLLSFPERTRKAAFHTSVCFSSDLESAKPFLDGLNDGQNLAASLWSGRSCEQGFVRSKYKDSGTYLLLGSQKTLQNYVVQKTLWVLVSTVPDTEQFRTQLGLAVPEKLQMVFLASKITQNSREKRNAIEEILKEKTPGNDLRGLEKWPLGDITQSSVLLSGNFSQRKRVQHFNEHASQLLYLVYVAHSLANGSTLLERAGLWKEDSGLDLWKPLEIPSLSDFQRRHIILTTVHKPLVFEIKRPDETQVTSLREVTGYVAEVIRVLQRDLNFTVDLIFTNTFGTELDNGSWNGMMGDLTRKEADLSPLDFSPSWARAQAADFSEWFGTDEVIVISQAATPVSKPFLMLEVFSLRVWLAIIGTGIATGVLLFAIDLILKRHRDGNLRFHSDVTGHSSFKQQLITLQDTVGAALKLFLIQGSTNWPSTWSGRSLSCCFFLVVISVVALYQGYIIAFLAVPRRASPIDSAQDLMKRLDKVTPIVRKNTVYYTFLFCSQTLQELKARVQNEFMIIIFTSNFESYRPIAEKLRFHQDSFLDTWEFFKMIQEGVYALIDTYSSGVGRAAAFESRGKECRFHVSKTVLKNDWDHMVHPQNSVFREQIDGKIRQLRSFGIIEKIKKQYYTASCEREYRPSGQNPLSITKVQSAFYVLAAGHLISAIVFITEKMAWITRRISL